ncbi:MAG: hypothetical protein E7128_00980 [Rikenellaceae bacterium]|nr:hypothetical protein [Rikenellaceae bacterium]
MRKLVPFIILFAAVTLTSAAQDLSTYRRALQQPDSIWGAKVLVCEATDVASQFSALAAKPKQGEIYGYRIEIFTENGQSARAAAFATCEAFSEQYPDVPAKVSYDKLYWKVTVGQCASAEEAIALWGQIKQQYPKAFLARETIEIENLNK